VRIFPWKRLKIKGLLRERGCAAIRAVKTEPERGSEELAARLVEKKKRSDHRTGSGQGASPIQQCVRCRLPMRVAGGDMGAAASEDFNRDGRARMESSAAIMFNM